MLEIFEEVDNLPAKILIYIIMASLFWYLPQLAGMQGYDLKTKLGITIVLIPITHFIVDYYANK